MWCPKCGDQVLSEKMFAHRRTCCGPSEKSDEAAPRGVDAGTGLPAGMQLHTDFGEPDVLFNMRDWIRRACEAQGARFTGGGIGMGAADIDIEIDGHKFNVRIKPITSLAAGKTGDK